MRGEGVGVVRAAIGRSPPAANAGGAAAGKSSASRGIAFTPAGVKGRQGSPLPLLQKSAAIDASSTASAAVRCV